MTRTLFLVAVATLAIGCGQPQDEAEQTEQAAAGAPEPAQSGGRGQWEVEQDETEVILANRMGAEEPAFVMTCRRNENVLQIVAPNPSDQPLDLSQNVTVDFGEQSFAAGLRPMEGESAPPGPLRLELPLSPELLAALLRAQNVTIAVAGRDVQTDAGAERLTDFAGRCAVLTGVELPNVTPQGVPNR